MRHTNSIKAAFGKVSITPPINEVYPDFFFKPDGVLDDIFARIAVIQSTDAPVLVIAVDTLGLGVAETAELEEAVTDATGVVSERILITSSHSHSAPILCPIDLYGGFGPYFDGLRQRVVQLASDLLKQVEPMTLSTAKSHADLNVNRRLITAEGNCVMLPNPDGVVDKSVPVLACHRVDGTLAGVFFSYCCHPTILLGPKISGDYPGQAQLALEARHRGTTALYLSGMFANIRPALVSTDGPFRSGTPTDAMRFGSLLADAVDDALKALAPVPVEAIRTWRLIRPLPLGQPLSRRELDALIAQAVKSTQTDEKSASTWQDGYQLAVRGWAQRVRLEQLEERVPKAVNYTFSRWDIGNLSWLTFSGEFFLEYGLYAQELLGTDTTWTLGYAHGCQSYVTTAVALTEGGYEPNAYKRWGHSAPFAPSVEDAVKSIIRELAEIP